MKKFISAVTSICMTATMLAAAVPATVANAATDTQKGYSIRVEGETDNYYEVSAADVAAGDVTIPCGFYIEEETEGECAGILATFGISEDCPDTSAIQLIDGGAVNATYWDTAKEYTTSEGTTFSTKYRPIFTGKVQRGTYTANATQWSHLLSEDQAMYGVNLPNIVLNWISTSGSVWLGATSDEFPFYYFDVVIKQGAPEGEYKIDFYDFFKDEAGYQPSNTIGSTTLNYEYTNLLQSKTGEGTLYFEPLTIKVGEGESKVTTTTTPTPVKPTTTTTTAPDTGDGEGVTFDWKENDLKANAGDQIFADMTIDTNGQAAIGIDMGLTWRGGEDSALFNAITYVNETSAAFGDAGLVTNWSGNPASPSATLVDKDGNPMSATFNAALGIKEGDGDDAKYIPQAPIDGEVMTWLQIDIPADCPDGDYYLDLAYIVLNKDSVPTPFTDITYVPLHVQVGDGGSDVVTTTTTTATTPKPTTTTTVTTPKPTAPEDPSSDPGAYLLGDTNCDGKVNVADVVILNKYLAGKGDLMTDQGKINGEVTAPTTVLSGVDLTYEDSTYIIQSIIHLWTLTDNGPVATEYNK